MSRKRKPRNTAIASARATRVLGAGLTLALLAISAWALSAAAFKPGRVSVKPPAGSPDTVFELTFKTPERTGVFATSQRHDMLTASAPAGNSSCITSIAVRAPDASAGKQVYVRLLPHHLGGRWCLGTYRGEIDQIQSAVCRHGTACPLFELPRGVVGRFTLRITTRPGTDTRAPTFAGLERAFACTPGPQRLGQTTPYSLSWKPATDDTTPSSQITYYVYYATHSGGEDFSRATWTTRPGSTSFRTPGLPSHGTAYFVVRARPRRQCGR